MKPRYTLNDLRRHRDPRTRLLQAVLFVANELHDIAEALREKKR